MKKKSKSRIKIILEAHISLLWAPFLAHIYKTKPIRTKHSCLHLQYSLFPSQATILTLSILVISCTSLNSTSFSINVHTLSQNRYVFSLPALKVKRDLTFVASVWLMHLSNWRRTLHANCGVIWPYWNFLNLTHCAQDKNHGLPELIRRGFLEECVLEWYSCTADKTCCLRD